MLSFVLRRLLTALPTLFLVIVAAFFMMRAAPGGPFDGERQLPPAIEAAVKAKYGLDQPLPPQFVSYIGGVVRGDLGPSLKYRDKTVVDILKENYGVSLTLGLAALIVGSVAGVTLGVVAALILLATYPAEVLVVLTLLYLGLIPLAWRRHKALEQADAERAAQEKALSGASEPEKSSGAA